MFRGTRFSFYGAKGSESKVYTWLSSKFSGQSPFFAYFSDVEDTVLEGLRFGGKSIDYLLSRTSSNDKPKRICPSRRDVWMNQISGNMFTTESCCFVMCYVYRRLRRQNKRLAVQSLKFNRGFRTIDESPDQTRKPGKGTNSKYSESCSFACVKYQSY